MQQLQNYQLQPFCQNFCQQFNTAIQQRNGPNIIHSLRVAYFWNQSNEGGVDALKIDITVKKS